MKIRLNLIILLSAIPFLLNAQPWMQKNTSSAPTYTEIQQAFQTYWKDKEPGKGSGYKNFKRWEYFWSSRVLPDGSFPAVGARFSAWEKYQQRQNPRRGQAGGGNGNSHSTQSGNWVSIGPFHSAGGYTGIGRLNTIEFHPSDPNTYFVGSPSGGLWQTTDNGQSWFTHTDHLPSLGVSAIVVDYSNPQHIYIGTGDCDGGTAAGFTGLNSRGDTHSAGILKSTDGGQTFQPTGLSWITQNTQYINRLLQHPTDSATLLAATSLGIYRTTDAGTSWTQTQAGDFKDLEVSSLDSSIWYASSFNPSGGTGFYYSSDEGITWTLNQTFPWVNRINIAVIPQNGEVHLLCASATDNGFYGLYKSRTPDVSGSFTLYSSSPNILSWMSSGAGMGGQGIYDLAFTADPIDTAILYVGGINLWKINHIQNTSTCLSMWINGGLNPGNLPLVHADQHFLAFKPGTQELYTCNDGGLYKSNSSGISWTEITHTGNGPVIGQFYRIGLSEADPNLMMGAMQDNGTIMQNQNGWQMISGGDGSECMIDPADTTFRYMSTIPGKIFRSSDAGISFPDDITANINGSPVVGWIFPYQAKPGQPHEIILGMDNLYLSTNRGNTWQLKSQNQSGGIPMQYMDVSTMNTDIMVAGGFQYIMRTTDAGSSWNHILPSQLSTQKITAAVSDPVQPDRIWITCSSYDTVGKVFYTSDGGQNWTDLSGTLPDIPVNCISYTIGSQDALYIGTDLGVFYRDANMSDWIPYNSGLPNVIITELEILYGPNIIRAASYGRGIWESPLADPAPGTPITDFSASAQIICAGDNVSFQDLSNGSPTQWNWFFPGGNPSTSTLQNPVVNYANAGTYLVSLITSNTHGSSSKVKPVLIRVGEIPAVNPFVSGAVCEGGSLQLHHANLYGCTYHWSGPNGFTAQNYTTTLNPVTASNAGVYSLEVSYPGCSMASDTVQVIISPTPAAPDPVSNNGPVCSGKPAAFSAGLPPGTQALWLGPQGFYSIAPSPGIGNSSANNAGMYSVYAIAQSCTSAVSTTTLVVHPTPATPMITVNGNILSSSQTTGNQWYKNTQILNGETSQNLDISLYGGGAYTCQTTSPEGCHSLISAAAVAWPVRMDSEISESEFKIYPNPNSGEFFIEMKNTEFRIWNAEGKEILFNSVRHGDVVKISGLKNGIYWIEVEGIGKKVVVGK